MATSYKTVVANHVKQRGTKVDTITPRSTTDTLSDLDKMLLAAKRVYELRVAENDTEGAKLALEKVELLEGTINNTLKNRKDR